MPNRKNHIEILSPAKVNLCLAVTGEKTKGYHELVSLVAKLDFGDKVLIEKSVKKDALICDGVKVPSGSENLAFKALQLFRKHYLFKGFIKITLEKHIPIGAGLGGGSSNAVAVLKGVNELLGFPLNKSALHEIASSIGSDCPLFLEDGPVIMRGRGESLEPLGEEKKSFLDNVKVLVFKPPFSINTACAYSELEGKQKYYLDKKDAEQKIKEVLLDSLSRSRDLLFNNFEDIIFRKYKALGLLSEKIKNQLGLKCCLSGSGSACFIVIQGNEGVEVIEALKKMIEEVFGKEIFMVESTFE